MSSAGTLRTTARLSASGAVTIVALALAVAAYVWLASRHVSLPGLYFDETLRTGDALAIVTGRPALTTADWWVSFAGRRWPVMSNPYTGSVKSYLWALAFKAFGVSVPTLRLTAILVTALGLIWVALLARGMLGGWPAVAAVSLLATDPSLILYTRTDWGPIAVGFALRTGLLYFLWRWWIGGGRRTLVIAGLIAGLGIWDKASFVWVIAAILVVGSLACLASRDRPSLSPSDLAWALGASLLSSAPFWIYNATRHWATVQAVALPGDPVSLAGILGNVFARSRALREMFEGVATSRWMFGDSPSPHVGFTSTWLLPMSILSGAVVLIVGIATRRVWFWAVPALTVLILAQIYLTPRTVWVHHWITIYPLPHLAIGMALSSIALLPSRLRVVRAAVFASSTMLVALAVSLNVLIMADYQRMMERTGGSGLWSDAIYRLTDAMQQRYSHRQLQVMDWGISNQLIFLSQGDLTVRGLFWFYMTSTEPQALLVDRIRNPSSVFLIFAPEAKRGSRAREALEMAARTACVRIRHTEQFADRQSTPVILLLEYEPGSCSDPIHR